MKIKGKVKGIKGNSQKGLPSTQETMVVAIGDHPEYPYNEMTLTLTQVIKGQIMIEEEVEDKAPSGDQNVLTLLTHKWL